MNVLIVYYSLTGDTEYIVQEIEKKIKCDLFKIELVNEYPKKGFKKFFFCGKSACLEDLVEFKNGCNLDKYDEVILANPIWASNITPPLRSFIIKNRNKLKDKKISIVLSYSGGGDKKVIEKFRECLDVSCFQQVLVLKNSRKSNIDKQIEEFCYKLKN